MRSAVPTSDTAACRTRDADSLTTREHLADRLRREAGPLPADKIQLAWQLALARPAKPDELAAMQRFLAEETASQLREATAASKTISPDESAHAALAQLCRVVLNLNEFVYPD